MPLLVHLLLLLLLLFMHLLGLLLLTLTLLQLVLFGAAVGPLAAVALFVATVSVQPAAVVAGESVVFSARSAVFGDPSAQAASDVQAVADLPARSAFDGLAQDVGVQSVSGGLPCARLTFQVAFLFPVAGPAVPPAFFAGPPKLFPAPPVFVCPVRWIAGSRGSAVARVSPTYRPGRPPVFFPVP